MNSGDDEHFIVTFGGQNQNEERFNDVFFVSLP